MGAGVSVDNSPIGVDVGSDLNAGGLLTGNAQIVAAPDLGDLNSAIGGISGQLSRLNGALSGAAGQLADDVRQINKKFGEVTDTLQTAVSDAASNAKDVVTDASPSTWTSLPSARSTAAKTARMSTAISTSAASPGSMAIEYSYDPEDDVTSDLSPEYKRQYELKAVIQECTNEGAIQAKRSYAGGVCGRMDLGLITDSCGFGSVASDSGDYVGGIARSDRLDRAAKLRKMHAVRLQICWRYCRRGRRADGLRQLQHRDGLLQHGKNHGCGAVFRQQFPARMRESLPITISFPIRSRVWIP